MKKFKSIFVALLTIVLLIPSSAFASSGWDPVGTSTFSIRSVQIYSTGGDFMACLASGQTWHGNVQLFERDGNDMDTQVDNSTRELYLGHCAVWRDISGYKDGDNNKAEFYIEKEVGDSKTIKVEFFD